MISNRQIMQIALQKPERNGKDTSQVRWGLFEQFLGRVSQPGGPPAEIPELVPMAQVLVPPNSSRPLWWNSATDQRMQAPFASHLGVGQGPPRVFKCF